MKMFKSFKSRHLHWLLANFHLCAQRKLKRKRMKKKVQQNS